MKIGLVSIVSEIHNQGRIDATLQGFLEEIEERLGYELCNISIEEAGEADLPVVFIKSGGVEGEFKKVYERLSEPYILLSSDMHNSFAASLEILSFLRQQDKAAEIVHGSSDYIAGRLMDLSRILKAKERLQNTRLGVIGRPSDWLISSDADYSKVREYSGMEIIDIGMDELIKEVENAGDVGPYAFDSINKKGFDPKAVEGALKIYGGFKSIVNKYNLQGITVRCFDLLGPYKNTGCLGMALLNDEGIIAACEGDVPALMSMVVLNYLTGEPVFMANPSKLDVEGNSLILAHCTVPTSMTQEYHLDTHFESGLGVGIRGIIKKGRATIFKVSGDFEEFFVSGAQIKDNLNDRNYCRTQICVRPDEDVRYFLKDPIGNHHIVCRGDHSSLVKEFFKWL